MACVRCGECCTNLSFVHPADNYLARFFNLHGALVKFDGDVMVVEVAAPCRHYDYGTRSCGIWATKPDICHRYACAKAQARKTEIRGAGGYGCPSPLEPMRGSGVADER